METNSKKQRQHFYRDSASGQWSMSEVELQRAPTVGEHNDAVLRADLELGDDDIGALRKNGILG
jgi:hypothetical protein